MAKFHSIRIAEVKRETPEAVSITFDVPENLKDQFLYKQGQYITIKMNLEGKEIRRSYSVCSNPYSKEPLKVAVKEVKNGTGSVFLNRNIKSGDTLEIMPPMGNFYSEMNANHSKTYYLFAGGSGITPMMSILKSVLSEEPQSNVVLFYGNLNETATIFKSEIDEIANGNNNFKVHYIFEKPENVIDNGVVGIMTEDVVSKLIDKYIDITKDAEFFICGPTPMMQNVEGLLREVIKNKNRIHLEYFSSPLEEEVKTNNTAAQVSDKPVNAKALIICDADELEIDVPMGKNILDAALDAGIDAPFACQGGSCCTCRALLIEGKVKMKVNFALSEQEVADGYILTCQSLPLTEKVVVDYDKGR